MSNKSYSRSDSSRSSSSSSRSSKRQDRSSRNSEQKLVSHPLYICIPTECIEDVSNECQNLKNRYQVDQLYFDKNLEIPDSKKQVLKIQDQNFKKKINLAEDLINFIFQKINAKSYKNENSNELQILVSDGLVNALIGRDGRNLNQMSDQSRANINLEQKFNKFPFRSVLIQGKVYQIVEALKLVQSQIESSDEKYISHNDSVGDDKTTAKFIFDECAMGFLIGKRGYNIKEINHNNHVQCKIVSYYNFQCTEKGDSVIIINGPLKKVIQASEDILQRIDDYYNKNNKKFSDHSMKIIMNTNHVNKLIGTGGKSVQEIAKKSGAPQIKILSDEKNKNHECIVKVMGSLKNKIQASEMILNSLEQFKSGGQNNDKITRNKSRSLSRSQKKGRRSSSRSITQKRQKIRTNSFKEEKTQPVQEIQKQRSPSKEKKLMKFTTIISVKMMQKLIENDSAIFKKITNESLASLQILPMEEDDSLYLEIKGKLESTKKAVFMVIDEQQKLE